VISLEKNYVCVNIKKRTLRSDGLRGIMFKKIICLLILVLFIVSCAQGGKYYSLENLKPPEIQSAHYLFQDDDISLGVKIRSGGIRGHFFYDLVIINSGDKPVRMNWVYDVLSLSINNKTFQLSKMTSITYYPGALNPDTYKTVFFAVPKRFNQNINDVEKLIFQFNDKNYTLTKNKNAVWQ
jgi:hypothetical protein